MKTLKTILVLFIAVVALPCFSQQKNIGLQLYSLRDDVGRNFENIGDIISKVGKMGYKYVETANYADGKFYGMTPQEFKAKLAANGMFALSSHTGRALASNISQTNWDETWAWWDQAIADHKAAGMKYIITASMPTPETLDDLKAYCDYYNKVGEKCAAAGLMFGYHNHAAEFETSYSDSSKPAETNANAMARRNSNASSSPRIVNISGRDYIPMNRANPRVVMYDYMVENTDPSKVFFEMDVYWVVRGQRSPVDLFKKYPGRFLVLHVKDDKELGRSGMVGFDAIFNNIETAGTKYLIIEVENYNLPRFESVQVSLDYLNKANFVKADYSK